LRIAAVVRVPRRVAVVRVPQRRRRPGVVPFRSRSSCSEAVLALLEVSSALFDSGQLRYNLFSQGLVVKLIS
jgi:hypothetical protein